MRSLTAIFLSCVMTAACDPTDAHDDAACVALHVGAADFVDDSARHDAPPVLELLDLVDTPAEVEQACRAFIEAHGARIVMKGDHLAWLLGRGSTAFGKFVFLSPSFDSWLATDRAETMCHEAVHIVWQHRSSSRDAAINYIRPDGRVGIEAVAYAVGFAVREKFGADHAWIERQIDRIAAGFPETYHLEEVLAEPQCVADIMIDAWQVVRGG